MPFVVIAHRGASGTRPENTLAAFRRAEAIGAGMIELDVQLTRDREVVVIHDWTLERTTSGAGAVRERTLDEIRRLDAGAWFGDPYRGERVPTLAEVLSAVALPVNVELKPVGDDGLEASALAVVAAAGALRRVVFSSFDASSLERLRRRSSDAVLAVLWDGPMVADAVHLAERVSARALHVRKEGFGPEVLAFARTARLPVRLWTVNDPGEMARLAAPGVDGVFTDFPERFLHFAAVE